jgi:hypothetical protein
MLLIIVFAWHDAPGWVSGASVVAFIGGFAALVTKLPDRHGDPDDDGAVL